MQDCEEAESLDPREFAAWFNEVSLHSWKFLSSQILCPAARYNF